MIRYLLPYIFLSICGFANSQEIIISCGPSEGYSYFFEGGVVAKERAGFQEDAIAGGQYSLVISAKGEADILAKDATGILKSAKSQGGNVFVNQAGENGFNWVSFYEDGTIEIYSYSFAASKAVAYRNTMNSALIGKNSIMVSECD